MSAIILDTETTGLVEPQVIQLAHMGPLLSPFPDDGIQKQLFRPTKPIELSAMATHHILEDDLVDAPAWPGAWPLPPGTEYIVGHNVDFDWKAIGSPNVKRICTLALARESWPKLESHSLPVLTYHLCGDKQEARYLLRNAHDAAADVELCCRVLVAVVGLLGLKTWTEVWAASERARIPKVMPFGKHKGVPLTQVPSDYKRWLLGQPDVDPYLVQALRA